MVTQEKEQKSAIRVKFLRVPSLLFAFILCSGTVRAEPAPDFALTDIDGNTFSLADFKGKVVLLDFFATWCEPCKAEIPHLKEVKEKFGESIVIISISVDPGYDSVERLRQFRDEREITWTLARDEAGLDAKYAIAVLPTLFIIDRNGDIRFRHPGFTDKTIIVSEVDGLMASTAETITQTITITTTATTAIRTTLIPTVGATETTTEKPTRILTEMTTRTLMVNRTIIQTTTLTREVREAEAGGWITVFTLLVAIVIVSCAIVASLALRRRERPASHRKDVTDITSLSVAPSQSAQEPSLPLL